MKQVGKKIEEFNNNYDEKIAALYRDFFETQKRKELNEKDNVILSLAKKLKDSGTSITEIALMTKLDIKVIENL